MYVNMYLYSVMTIYIAMIMDELVKGMNIDRDENPKRLSNGALQLQTSKRRH